jgi:predicted dehydrogenase
VDLAERNNGVRLGVIGAGFIAQVAHLYSFSRISGVRLVALSEPHDSLRHAVAGHFGIEHATSDYHALLDRTDLDAVIVCVPRRAQSLVVADALAKAPAVLSEKPAAMTFDEAQRMIALVKNSRTTWAVGYMKRHDVGVRGFAKLLTDLKNEDRLGAILEVSMRDACGVYGVAAPEHVHREGKRPSRYPEAPVAPDFVPEDRRADYEYTLNVASHDINLLRLFFGNGLAADNFSVRRGGAQLALLDAGAFPISLTVMPANLGRWDQCIDVTFARGRASLMLPSPLARQESASIVVENNGRSEEIRVSPADHIWAFEAQARAFVGAINSGTEPENSGEDSLADLALIDSLWRRADLR